MKNRYEFKIEEINSVIITMKDESQYTTSYNREYDEEGNPTRSFVVTYSAEPDICADDYVCVICPRCEIWNSFDKEKFYSDDFKYKCCNCNDDYEEIIDENDLINIIESVMEEDTFFDNKMLINYIPIV